MEEEASLKERLDFESLSNLMTNEETDFEGIDEFQLTESDYEAERQEGENSENVSLQSIKLIESNRCEFSTPIKFDHCADDLKMTDDISRCFSLNAMSPESVEINSFGLTNTNNETKNNVNQSYSNVYHRKYVNSSTSTNDSPYTKTEAQQVLRIRGLRSQSNRNSSQNFSNKSENSNLKTCFPNINRRKDYNDENKNPNNAYLSSKSDDTVHKAPAPDDSKLSSFVFMLTPEKNLYKLTFDVANCFFIILYTERRDIDVGSNEKKIQPYSDKVYKHGEPLKNKTIISLLHNLRMNFRTDYRRDKIINKDILPVCKADVGFPKFKPKKKTKTHAISRTEKESLDSVIRAYHKGISFQMHPGVIQVDKIKPNRPELPHFTIVKQKLHLTGNKDRLNKGQMVIRYKNDILLFKFDLKNLTYGKYRTKVSVGTQIEASRDIYFQRYSLPNRRYVMVTVPKSLYEYEDLILKQVYYNRSNLLQNRIPSWQLELRKQRLKDSLIKPYEKDIEKITKIYNKSFLYFDGLNCEIRAITQVVNGTIFAGKEAYEIFVRNEQIAKMKGAIFHDPVDEFAQNVDKEFDFRVADYELLTQKQ